MYVSYCMKMQKPDIKINMGFIIIFRPTHEADSNFFLSFIECLEWKYDTWCLMPPFVLQMVRKKDMGSSLS